MKFLKNKLSIAGCLVATSICAVSCYGVYTYEPLKFKVLSDRGSVSYVLCGYFDDNNLTMEKERTNIEKAFESDEYGIIAYDTIKGLELCEKYKNFKLLQNYVAGNYCLISTNPDIKTPFEGCKILANDENGSLGAILRYVEGNYQLGNYSFVDDSSYALFSKIKEGEYLDSYDFIALDAPYAQRLIDLKEDNKAYGKVIQSLRLYNVYNKIRNPEATSYDLFYAQSSLFVNNSFLNDDSMEKNYSSFMSTITLTTNQAINNSYQTMTQFNRNSTDRNIQFETYGYSIDEIGVLQNYEEYNNQKIYCNFTRLSTTFTNDDLKEYLSIIGYKFDDNLFI